MSAHKRTVAAAVGSYRCGECGRISSGGRCVCRLDVRRREHAIQAGGIVATPPAFVNRRHTREHLALGKGQLVVAARIVRIQRRRCLALRRRHRCDGHWHWSGGGKGHGKGRLEGGGSGSQLGFDRLGRSRRCRRRLGLARALRLQLTGTLGSHGFARTQVGQRLCTTRLLLPLLALTLRGLTLWVAVGECQWT
jgi:hypothetical protein